MKPAATIHRLGFPRRRTAGSVILLVLVTVLLAAFLLTRFVQRAGTELLADARAGDQARLRREAYSALEVTLAVIADFRALDNGLHSPAQGWDRPLEYAGYTPADGLQVDVTFEDESGKIPLPRADAATLQNLLEVLGVAQQEAEQAADALLVWTKADYLPVSLDAGSSYERARLPHHAPERPLRSWAELASVEHVRDLFFDEAGRPTELARQFAANVSLYSFDRVNLNGVAPAVLVANGVTPVQVEALQNYTRQQRQAGGLGYFRSVGEAAAVIGGDTPTQQLGTDLRALRIIVTVTGGATTYRISAVVAPPGGAALARGSAPAATPAADAPKTAAADIKKLDYPFKVLEILEDMESPAPAPVDPTEHG